MHNKVLECPVDLNVVDHAQIKQTIGIIFDQSLGVSIHMASNIFQFLFQTADTHMMYTCTH